MAIDVTMTFVVGGICLVLAGILVLIYYLVKKLGEKLVGNEL